MNPYLADHFAFGAMLVLIALAASAIGITIDMFMFKTKNDVDLQIGRERNDAFRDVANARLSTGDNEFDDKKSQLDNAELQIALSTLNDRLQMSDQQREELEQRYAQVMEQLAALKTKSPAQTTSDAVVGSLGDADIIEEPSLDSSEIVFDEQEQLDS